MRLILVLAKTESDGAQLGLKRYFLLTGTDFKAATAAVHTADINHIGLTFNITLITL